MTEDFLPIPGASNYEVNSELVMRNKKHNKILKTGCGLATIYFDNGDHKAASVAVLRRRAEGILDQEQFRVIPSAPRYEMNEQGVIRLVQNKRVLQPVKGTKYYQLCLGGRKATKRTKEMLLHEVFGRPVRYCHVLPLTLVKGNTLRYFYSASEAARYLMPIIFYSFSHLTDLFRLRKPEVYGWKVYYSDDRDWVEQLPSKRNDKKRTKRSAKN